MDDETGMTSAPAESGGMDMTEGANTLAARLFGKSETTTPERDEDEAPAPDDDAEEAVGTEAEGDEPEASDDGTDEDDDTPQEPQSIRLSDGTEATLKEIEAWRKGNLRESDYTRKTQELGEQRKVLERQFADVSQLRGQYQSTLEILIGRLQRDLPPRPNEEEWDSDPIAAMQAERAYQQRLGEIQEDVAQYRNHMETQQKQYLQATQEHVIKETETLVKKMPFLNDPAKREEFGRGLKSAAAYYGFTEAELASITDHRTLMIAHDAMKYRELQAKRPKVEKKVAAAAPVVRPGKAAAADQGQKSRREAVEKLRRTGSIEDGAEALKRILFS